MIPPPPRLGWPHVFLAAAVVSLAAMGWTLGDGPLLDDNPLIYTAQADSWEKIKLLFQPHLDVYWRPLAKLTLVPGAALFGFATWPHRLTALLLHALATTLVWSLARRLSGRRAGLLAAFLFLIHPIHVGTLYWISARYDLTATVLVLAAVLTALPRQGKTARGGFFWPALLTFFACLAKEIAFVAPLLVGLTLWTLPETRAWRRLLRGVGGPFFALFLALALRHLLMGRIGGTPEMWTQPPGPFLTRTLFAIPFFLAVPFHPASITTAPTLLRHLILVPVIIAVWLLILFIKSVRRRSVWYGLLFGLVSALPLSGFIYLGPETNSLYMLYLPSVGAVIFAASVLSPPAGRLRQAIALAASLAAAGLVFWAFQLPAYHRASAMMDKIVRQTIELNADRHRHRLLLDIPVNQVRGITMFYDEVAEFFLPYPKMNGKEIHLAGPNFWRRAGAGMLWREENQQRDTAVFSWSASGPPSGEFYPAPFPAGLDQTDEVHQAWRRRAKVSDEILRLRPQCPSLKNVTCLAGEIAWHDGPVSIPLAPLAVNDADGAVDVASRNVIQLTEVAISTADFRRPGVGRFSWTPKDETPRHILFEWSGDGEPHSNRFALAADPRWATTETVSEFWLTPPFREGKLTLME